MRDAVVQALIGFEWFILVYFVVLNTVYLAMVVLGALEVRRTRRWEPTSDLDEIFANPLTPGVSVVAPAYNEELSILESVRAILRLRYPEFELIVVDDGSTDRTFEILREEYDLQPIERVIPQAVPTLGKVLSVHAAAGDVPLIVVRKENTGRRSDASNVGISAARKPLVCIVDSDSVLDENALLLVARPFVEDPERVVATGGVVRAMNGAVVRDGVIQDVRLPTNWLARIQVVEYLRSFLLGRTGWSRIGGLLIISGAFGLFRRDLLHRLGGYDLENIGEDAEMVTRIHAAMRDEGVDYRIVFVSEPVCWTEVPDRLRGLAGQRRRWSLGGAEVIWKHRRLVGNPRYGVVGLLTLPFFLLFEVLGPVIELIGLVTLVVGAALGLLNPQFALLVGAVAVFYGLLLSAVAIAVEEFSFRRYRRWSDLLLTLASSLLEWVGYRQLHAWWRLQGLYAAVRGRRLEWGVIERTGFASDGTGGSDDDDSGPDTPRTPPSTADPADRPLAGKAVE